jgi:hypothetical protein
MDILVDFLTKKIAPESKEGSAQDYKLYVPPKCKYFWKHLST